MSYPLGVSIMSGRLLSFKDYTGGADNVQVIELFPRSKKSFTYDFDRNVTGWNFSADYQTIVLDQVTYDRVTGDPNFTDTTVIGYFGTASNVSGSYIDETSASTGQITLTIPENRYTGSLTPNARENVAMTVLSFEWETDDSPNTQKDSHRWAIIERWEPSVSPGDPTLSNSFIRLGVGAISTFSDNASTDAARANGVYSGVSGITNSGSEGQNATFEVVVDDVGATGVNITARGTGYAPGDTITILDSSLGSGGAADITVTVLTSA